MKHYIKLDIAFRWSKFTRLENTFNVITSYIICDIFPKTSNLNMKKLIQ